MSSRVIVKEEDFLPVKFDKKTNTYNCDGLLEVLDTDPEQLRVQALRLLSIAEELKSRAAAERERAHEEWLAETILPMARVMYNNFREDSVTEEEWMRHWKERNHAAVRWVVAAEKGYKFLHPEDADK